MFNNDTEYRLQTLCKNNTELQELVSEYDNEVKYLLSSVTHEIKNPLTLIYSTLQLIERKNPDVTQFEYWSTLTEDMKDVFSLLDDLSNFNHCDTLHKTNVDLLKLLTDLKVSFEPLANEHNNSITITLGREIHPIISSYLCDEIKLKQVFTNLIKNAIEATSSNSTIELHLYKTTSATILPNETQHQDFLAISLTNTCEPLSTEELAHLFVPFVTTKKNGTGLGLATAKRIISSHNGYLFVSSKENKITFTVYLPI